MDGIDHTDTYHRSDEQGPFVSRASRDDWIAAAFDVLREGGIGALMVEPLAERLFVTKGSFYHHFENRRALHLAMLDEWEAKGTSQIIAETEDASGLEPDARLRHLAHRTMGPDPVSDGIEISIRAWARTDPTVAEAAARIDRRRVDYAASLLRASGLAPTLARRRSRMLYRILIGEFMWRSSGGPVATAREIDETVDAVLDR